MFVVPGEDRGRPLADSFVSRQPFYLQDDGDNGIQINTSGASLIADGEPLSGGHTWLWEAVEEGVVLLLAQRVVLLLHCGVDRPPLTLPAFGLVGESNVMARLRLEIHQVAEVDVPVLLRGATGTGKELVALAIHQAGRRRTAPYVAVNMAAVPPSLASSELFGSAKGAFTGAVREQPGLFGRADGGTLFLDEIGEMPPEVQVMLLRVLETGEVQPVGGGSSRRVDVRVLAATDADLEDQVSRGTFKAPLLHRLSGYEIDLPPLSRRRDDFGRLLYHFLDRELAAVARRRLLHPPPEGAQPWLPASLVAWLAAYPWPGNVRQLRNVARQLVIGCRDETFAAPTPAIDRLLTGIANPRLVSVPPSRTALRRRKPAAITERKLRHALREQGWELKATARSLGISRSALYTLIDRSPRIRKASDIDRREIEQAIIQHGDDLDLLAETLEVSRAGLAQHMRSLGLC